MMSFLMTSTARDKEVLEFWNLNAQWHRAAVEAMKAYLG